MFLLPRDRGYRSAAVALCFSAALGCGYRFAPPGEGIGRDIEKIYVDVFANNTAEPKIEASLRNAFIEQLIRARRFTAVATEEAADAVLRGSIENSTASPLAYRSGNVAVEERLSVVVTFSLQDRKRKKVIWKKERASYWKDYTSDAPGMDAREMSRSKAFLALARDVAERSYRMMVSDF